MSVKERDPLTGHMTTGHEWNGITELNTRVPRAVWFFIIVTHIWAVAMWFLVPAWPLVTTYTEGLLGIDQRDQVEQEIAAATIARSDWTNQIIEQPISDIRADAALMNRVGTTAPALFGDNCAACHGTAASGGPGYPSLVDQAWLWGGDAEAIMETLRVGINAQHPETRRSQMLAFGRLGVLSSTEVRTLVDHVQSLSVEGISPGNAGEGAALFAQHCASCHGEDGSGLQSMGAPDLTDDFWIYGGDARTIFDTIWDGREGLMPAWDDRLSLADRKILTIYLQELAGEDPE
jgi:cytochrome c oxidase cbb3-type subunit 3